MRLLVQHLPAAMARRLVHSTERGWRRPTSSTGPRSPSRPSARYAERRLAEGHDLLILGHFHEERRWQVPGGEVWLLEAWFSSRRVEWLRG